jgi:hypothetical protein
VKPLSPLRPAGFITASVVVNASLCPLLFLLMVLEMSSTGYISGFNAPGAAGEVIGSMIGVGLGTAVIALAAASLVSSCYLFRRGDTAKRTAVPAHVAITTVIMTPAINAVLTILFLTFLIGMHST